MIHKEQMTSTKKKPIANKTNKNIYTNNIINNYINQIKLIIKNQI